MNEKRCYDDERLIRLIGDPVRDYQHNDITVHVFKRYIWIVFIY